MTAYRFLSPATIFLVLNRIEAQAAAGNGILRRRTCAISAIRFADRSSMVRNLIREISES